MIFSIDLDRGAMCCQHPTMGMDIYMYLDDPGVYLTPHGEVLKNGEELARAAGFDVDKYAKDRKIKLAMQEAQDEVLSKFGETTNKVLAERQGFKVMELSLGRVNVLSPDGDVLNKEPIPREQGMILLEHLAPEKKEHPIQMEKDKK